MTPQIPEYEIVRKLGHGASATVWHAIYRGIKPCALKVFENGLDQPEVFALFRDEVRTAMSFTHGSVVQVFDAGENDGNLWIACEWVDGVSLEAFSRALWDRGGKWPRDLAAYVIGRLLVALSYIHEFSIAGKRMNVVHRDIKPANVIVSAGGEVKLTDFGISIMWHDDSPDMLRGTVRYMSKEQLVNQPCQESDLFATGAILHELLANERFRSSYPSSSPELYNAILDDAQIGEVDAPLPLEQLRKRLLAPIGERIKTAREAHALLMAWPHYRPGEFGLASFFQEVMGRAASSGVTLHDRNMDFPDTPLPLRYRSPSTLELSPAPEPGAPVALRRRPATEILPPPFVPREGDDELAFRVFCAKDDLVDEEDEQTASHPRTPTKVL